MHKYYTCTHVYPPKMHTQIGRHTYLTYMLKYLQTFPFLVLDAGPKVSSLPEAHFSYWPVFIIRRISLCTMSICWIIAIGAPIWLWFVLAFVFCLHTVLTINVWILDERSRDVMEQGAAFVRRCASLLGICKRSPILPEAAHSHPEAGPVAISGRQCDVRADQASVLLGVSPSVKHQRKVQPCLQGLVRHAAWGQEPVKRFVDVAEGVLRSASIHKCELARAAVESLINSVTDDVQKHYPDVFAYARLGPSTKLLCAYQPEEKNNSFLKAEIDQFLQHEGVPPHATVSKDSQDAEMLKFLCGPADESHDLCIGRHTLMLSTDLDSDIDMRGLPLVYVANVWLWKSSQGDKRQYNLTQPTKECATFVSHSWSDSWWVKAIMLRNHLFLMEYDSLIFILGFVACTQALPISFLLQNVASSGLSFLPLYMVLFCMTFTTARAHLSGLIVPSTWGPWPKKLDQDSGAWLDKVCIDQTSAETKQKGIAKLAAYLVRCKTMTIMLGDTYFTRLWTTFELATYCKVHQENLADRLQFISLRWATTWNFSWLFLRVELDQREKDQLASYSCSDANCYMPEDRMVVLAYIRKIWGSEDKFDEFVRTNLPEVLRKGKDNFMWRTVKTMNSVLELLF